MKVAILSPESLPIPARKGGAVEGLIESIIECNEDKRNLQMDVFTIADDDEVLNQKIENGYKASSFVYFKKKRFIKLLDNLIMAFVRVVLKNKEVVGLDYIWKLYVVKRIKKEDVYNYALKEGVTLEDYELNIIYDYIKKDYKTIIYGNVRGVLDEIKTKVKLNTYNKIENLYLRFKNYLN